MHTFRVHVVITVHAGIGMQSVHRAAAHALACAACCGQYIFLMRLCGHHAELTVSVFCKLDNLVETLSVVLHHCWVLQRPVGCALMLIDNLCRWSPCGSYANTALQVDPQAVAKQSCCPDQPAALLAPLFIALAPKRSPFARLIPL